MTGQLLITLAIRTGAIAALSLVAGVVLRKARPSTRSVLWNSALFACLITPLAWIAAPPVTVSVPARFVFQHLDAVSPTTIASLAPAARNAKVSDATQRFSDPEGFETNGQALIALWLAGVVLVGFRFVRQVLAARRLVRGATAAKHALLRDILAQARASLEIQRDVAVLHSTQIDIPLATGILRPVILLPASVSEWSAEELRIVLLHELAHVRRADIVARVAAMCVCAIHWFNPLVWLLGNLSTRDAELAADDLVLSAGVRPSTYADALLNVAGSVLRLPLIQPAVPLARRAFLAHRVHAILRESKRRGEIGRAAGMLVVSATCAAALLAACVRLSPQSAAAFTTTSDNSTWIGGAADELIRALDDASPQVRMAAAHSLGQLHAQRARPRLLDLANDADKNVRYEANLALSALDARQSP
ncbi:MAG: M56 family metallopeptidase [Gemmatimonadaceae bacterium]